MPYTGKKSGVVFDLSGITPRQMQKSLEAISNGVDNEALAEVLTKVVTKCEYGDPKKIETWMDDITWLQLREIRADFMDAVIDLSKN